MTAPVVDRSGAADRFEHEVLFSRDDESFLAGVLPFVQDGLERDEAVVVAEPRPRLEQLRDALGDDSDAVQFLDMAEVGGNPARIIGVWAAVLQKCTDAGQVLRGVGEPAFPGRRDLELVECELHEHLLNRAFDGGPAWRLLCPYDEGGLPRTVVRNALRTHPLRAAGDARVPSGSYAVDGAEQAFAAPLPRPPVGVLRGGYGPADVPVTRRTVAQYARRCGLAEDQVEVLELAASELATTSVRHGGGSGTLAMWLEAGAVVVEFTDSGRLADPLLGRLAPPLDAVGGRGLYLVQQLCDLAQVRSSPDGTTVRAITWL
ncbi:MAG: anti-sigma factor RsbA family regulatory protein [Actinomycetes bacterium]